MAFSYMTETTVMRSEDRPATKRDLDLLRADAEQFRADVDQRFKEFRADVDQRFDQIDQRFDQLQEALIEPMRDMQTEVLRAFHSWARPFELRLRSLPQMEERLGLLEERVSAIERGDKPH